MATDTSIIHVSDSLYNGIEKVNVDDKYIDLRQYPQGLYNISIVEGSHNYTTIYKKWSNSIVEVCEEPDPNEDCVPLSFEENIAGTWTYDLGFGYPKGRVRINEDGTYDDILSYVISNGLVRSRTWYIENGRMHFEVEGAVLKPKWISFDCNTIEFDGEGFFEQIIFLRSDHCFDKDRLQFEGIYPRLLEETERSINLEDIGESVYNYTIELVNNEEEGIFSEYILEFAYVDNNPFNGDYSSDTIEYLRLPANQFSTNDYGNLQALPISIRVNELFDILGLPQDVYSKGDDFHFMCTIVLSGARSFTQENTSYKYRSSENGGHYKFDLNLTCPSNLEGVFNFVTSRIWCDSNMVSIPGTVTIKDSDDEGVYEFSDWYLELIRNVTNQMKRLETYFLLTNVRLFLTPTYRMRILIFGLLTPRLMAMSGVYHGKTPMMNLGQL